MWHIYAFSLMLVTESWSLLVSVGPPCHDRMRKAIIVPRVRLFNKSSLNHHDAGLLRHARRTFFGNDSGRSPTTPVMKVTSYSPMKREIVKLICS